MCWSIWATAPGFRRPLRYKVDAPTEELAKAAVLAGLRRGQIIDCAPEVKHG
jgi:hypothetical protein